MKYIWILILLGIEIIWLISFIMDIIHAIKYVKKFKLGDNIAEVIGYTTDELKVSSIGFISVHIAVLFMISFIVWISSLM